MAVRVLDTHKHQWSILSPDGEAPPQRGGHTVSTLQHRKQATHPQHVDGDYKSMLSAALACICLAIAVALAIQRWAPVLQHTN